MLVPSPRKTWKKQKEQLLRVSIPQGSSRNINRINKQRQVACCGTVLAAADCTEGDRAPHGLMEGSTRPWSHPPAEVDPGLKEVCRAQLQALLNLLGWTQEGDKVTLYLRNARPLDTTGKLSFHRVASWPPRQASSQLSSNKCQSRVNHLGLGSMEVKAANTGPEVGGPVADSGESCPVGVGLVSMSEDIVVDCPEETLIHEDIVRMPSSHTLVVPLTEGSVVVGMLVIQHTCAERDVKVSSILSQSEVDCLHSFVPVFSQVCAFGLQLQRQQVEVKHREDTLNMLLRDTKGPINAIQTFGAMLVPRLKDGEPEKDMARGIAAQGKRLQEVVWQAEGSLRHGSTYSSGTQLMRWRPAMELRLSEAQDGYVRMPTSEEEDAVSSRSSRSDLRLWPKEGTVLSPCSGGGSDGSRHKNNWNSVVHPAESSAALASASTSSLDNTFEWSDVEDISIACKSRSSENSESNSNKVNDITGGPERDRVSRERGIHTGAGRVLPDLGSSGTIVPPVDRAEVREMADSRQETTEAGFLGARSRCESVDVVSALTELLVAAEKLAKACNVAFIVSHPLQRIGSGAFSRTAAGSLDISPPGGFRTEEGPTGPGEGSMDVLHSEGRALGLSLAQSQPQVLKGSSLTAGVPQQVLNKSVGYVLDAGLQCCPPAGQVSVTARQDGGGVEIILVHTGQLLQTSAQGLAGGAWQDIQGAGVGSDARADRRRWRNLQLANQLVNRWGGKLTITHPYDFIHASTGALQSGTCTSLWFPGPHMEVLLEDDKEEVKGEVVRSM